MTVIAAASPVARPPADASRRDDHVLASHQAESRHAQSSSGWRDDANHTVPKIFWVSEPVLPGEFAVVAFATGGGTTDPADPLQVFGKCSATADGAWVALAVQGATEHGVSALVPATWPAGEFQLRLGSSGPAYTVNTPRPWFIFGDQGSFSTPGGTVRVIGDAIGLGAAKASVAQLLITQPSGKVLKISAQLDGGPPGSKPSRSHAFFELPSSLAVGVYPVAVANSATGTAAPLCTFLDQHTPCLATLNISKPFEWKSQIFTVNATQPGVGHDATTAVQSAVQAANVNGGVVFFPTGQYFIRGPIIVEPGVVLKGASRELVSIYFHEDNQTTAPAAYLTSSRPGAWGVEGLTFYITSFANDIVRFVPGTDGAFLRRSRIRFNSYFCLEPVEGKGSRGRDTAWSHAVGTAVKLAGQNIFVEDNDIYSSGDVVSTLNNGAAGAAFMHIARNTFWNGGTTHWGISW